MERTAVLQKTSHSEGIHSDAQQTHNPIFMNATEKRLDTLVRTSRGQWVHFIQMQLRGARARCTLARTLCQTGFGPSTSDSAAGNTACPRILNVAAQSTDSPCVTNGKMVAAAGRPAERPPRVPQRLPVNVGKLTMWVMKWILPANPTGYSPVGKPSTGCGEQHRRTNTNAGITGCEAHQNDGSNANATLIYSNTHDDPTAYTHTPSEARRRTCTIPTHGRHHGGTGAQRATVSGLSL